MERNLRREDIVDRYTYDIRIIKIEELLETLGTDDIIGWITLCKINNYIAKRKVVLLDDPGRIPAAYNDFLDVFSKTDSNTLLKYRGGYDNYYIYVEAGKHPEDLGYSPLYKMSLDELEVYREYILENLEKGFIELSTAPWAALVLLVKKPGGGVRFCVDYRKL